MVAPLGESQADHQENPLIIYDYRGIFLKKRLSILLSQNFASNL